MSDSDEQPHGENPSVGSASTDGVDKPSQAEGDDTTDTDGTSGGPGDKPSQADG